MESSEGNQIFGRIYKITSSETDDVYVGSTTKTLRERLSQHKSNYKQYIKNKYRYVKSFDILKFVDVKIELLSEGMFDNKHDLHVLEGQYIITTPNCINRCVAGRTEKQYKQDNAERLSENNKKYWGTHKDIYNAIITCPTCGGTYNKTHIKRHHNTIKHKNSVSSVSVD